MEYLWTKGVTPPVFPTLEGDKTTQVLVIGGGMAGVLCALQLHRQGIDVMLVEANRVGGGITRGTTAVLTAQHDTLYQTLVKQFGAKKAKAYLQANLQAVKQFGSFAKEINCDFEEVPSVFYSVHNREKMEQEVRTLQALGFNAQFAATIPLPFAVAGAVRFPNMAQFHPLKFLYGAVKELPAVYENTFVEKLEGTTAYTRHGTIRAQQVIVATHYPFLNSKGLYVAKLYQQRSFVIALENAPQLGCTLEDVAEDGVYLRNYNGLLLVGGGDSRTGKKTEGFGVPRAFAAQHFPKAKEVMAWANQDCVSLDGVPYIGPYSPSLPQVYVASGFNLWGMTSAMVAANILTDLVQGKENPFASVFSPRRSMWHTQLFANMGTTLLDFIMPLPKRCSHLGCVLRWNPVEHSWDCPCHGSRFDKHGALLDGPAMRDSHVE